MNIKILLTTDKSFSINNDNAHRTLHQHFSHNWKRTETHDIKWEGMKCFAAPSAGLASDVVGRGGGGG